VHNFVFRACDAGERRKLERTAPAREKILTVPTYKRRKRKSHVEKKSELEKEM